MSFETNDTFARITPVDIRYAGQVLNRWSNLRYSIQMILFQVGYLGTFLGGLMLLASDLPQPAAAAGTGLIALSLAWIGLIAGLICTFPEWPLNRRLCQRLRHTIEQRSEHALGSFGPRSRIVELVPRDRWNKLCLDTATDLMMLEVDDRGVWMLGDHCRYELPCAAILSAELQPHRPRGWFCPTYMVIICVRTQRGVLELPISYRDHSFGALRGSRRHEQTLQLQSAIQRIATGQVFESLSAPIRPLACSSNPYAAPAIVEDA